MDFILNSLEKCRFDDEDFCRSYHCQLCSTKKIILRNVFVKIKWV